MYSDRWDRSWCFALIKHRFPRTTPSDRGGFYNTHSNAFYFSRASATNFFIHFVRGLPTLINRAAIPPEIAANTFYSTTPHRDIFYIGASSRIRIAHGSSSPGAVPPPAMLVCRVFSGILIQRARGYSRLGFPFTHRFQHLLLVKILGCHTLLFIPSTYYILLYSRETPWLLSQSLPSPHDVPTRTNRQSDANVSGLLFK